MATCVGDEQLAEHEHAARRGHPRRLVVDVSVQSIEARVDIRRRAHNRPRGGRDARREEGESPDGLRELERGGHCGAVAEAAHLVSKDDFTVLEASTEGGELGITHHQPISMQARAISAVRR